MMRSGCTFKTATLISPVDGGSLSTGYYSSLKLVGLHIFQCTTSELESSTEMRECLLDRMGRHCFCFISRRKQRSDLQGGSIKVTLETSDWKINMIFSLLTPPAAKGFINYWRYSRVCLFCCCSAVVFTNCLIRASSFSCHLQSGVVGWQSIRCMIPCICVLACLLFNARERLLGKVGGGGFDNTVCGA